MKKLSDIIMDWLLIAFAGLLLLVKAVLAYRP